MVVRQPDKGYGIHPGWFSKHDARAFGNIRNFDKGKNKR